MNLALKLGLILGQPEFHVPELVMKAVPLNGGLTGYELGVSKPAKKR